MYVTGEGKAAMIERWLAQDPTLPVGRLRRRNTVVVLDLPRPAGCPVGSVELVTVAPFDVLASPEWRALLAHRDDLLDTNLRDLFAADPQRAATLTFAAADLHVDVSKQRITATTISRLVELARAAGVEARRDAMLRGEQINVTEQRAVLHTALRAPRGSVIEVDGHDVVADVHAVLDRMAAFADRVRSGEWKGATGRRIRTIVNIGIGGSDLGPAMAYRALRAFGHPDLDVPLRLQRRRRRHRRQPRRPRPGETLFVVSSKTFTTIETLTNAHTARAWLVEALGDEAGRRSTSSPSAPTPPRSRSSASTRPTCSGSGTGSAAATRSIRRSVCR